MAATIDEVLVGSIGDANFGIADTIGLLNPLAAQLDAMIAFGLGPLQADLAASLDASIAFQAALTLQVADPFANIRAALLAIIELQASLTAALSLPPVALTLGAEIGAAAALSASLSAKLGAIQLLLEAAINVKIPAVQLAASLSAAIASPGVVLMSFNGISDPTPLTDVGDLISTAFDSAIGNPPTPGAPVGGEIQPTDNVAGIIMVVKDASVFANLGLIIRT